MDCVVITTDHKEYREYDWAKIGKNMGKKVIVEGRRIVEPGKMRELGFVNKGIESIQIYW